MKRRVSSSCWSMVRLRGIYENIDGMKASKMKENLINDKEQAFLSKTLATIDTNAPIEIGLKDVVYSGPDVEKSWKILR